MISYRAGYTPKENGILLCLEFISLTDYSIFRFLDAAKEKEKRIKMKIHKQFINIGFFRLFDTNKDRKFFGAVIITAILMLTLVFPAEAIEIHGSFRSLYNPRKQRVYHADRDDAAAQYMAPTLQYMVDQQQNSIMRYYATEFATDIMADQESEYKIIHNFYQSFNLSMLDLVSENSSFILQGRYFSADAENQPDISVRQMYYKHKDLLPALSEFKLGRVLDNHAAGMVNYDGGSLQFDIKRFYMKFYGGLLIDNDYLHKQIDDCKYEPDPLDPFRTKPASVSCYTGNNMANEDYVSKWDAGDIRNFSSREREGDTIGGLAIGFRNKIASAEVDYQKKTDARKVAEELAGVNVEVKPVKFIDVYASARSNLMKGQMVSGLAGVAIKTDHWKIIPEYEYYRPHFKEGSFWEDFNVFGRSTVRLKVYRWLGAKFRMHISGGKVYYLEDNSKNESMTTLTTRDPLTGEVIGARDQLQQETPVNPLDLAGNPTSINPVTGQPAAVASRPMSLEELVVYELFIKNPYNPDNGVEGQAGFEYMTSYAMRFGVDLSTIQGPVGKVNKFVANFNFPWRAFRFKLGGGQAYYEEHEGTERGTQKATFFEGEANYHLTKSMNFMAGLEYYTDAKVLNDVRGKLGFNYAF